MKLYALKFKEKGQTQYLSVLIMAKDDDDMRLQWKEFLKDDSYNIDKRTVTWAGNSIPFGVYGKPEVLVVDLDEVN